MMKKNVFLMAITLVGLVACGGSANKSEKAENDSINAVTAEVEEEAEKTAPTFTSPDLKMFGLYGNVKEVSAVEGKGGSNLNDYISSHIFSGNRKLLFGSDGKWNKTGFDGFLDFKLTCNADGFVESVSHRESDGTTYKYTFKETDENGRPQKENYEEDGPIGLYKYSFSYEYSATDEHGNWTERKVSVAAHTESYEDGSTNDDHGEWTEVRKITYYE